MTDPYKTPEAQVDAVETETLEYAGFWRRVAAAIIDTILLLAITIPIGFAAYGGAYLASTQFVQGPIDFLLSYVFPAVAVITFWVYKSATPGKMVMGMKIVDANTGDKASVGKLIGRYFAYIPASIPLLLGIFWIGWDKKKQGWHDKMAGTLVVRR